jgi:hypothetical protein
METLLNARTYFAVELRPGEDAKAVSQTVLRTAKTANVLFKRLESMGHFQIGSTELVRFRTDASNISPVLIALRAQGRAIVEAQESGYLLRKNGRQGAVPPYRMLAVSCPDGQAVYLGTANEFWEEQFVGN